MLIMVLQAISFPYIRVILGVQKCGNQYAVKYRNFFFRGSPWVKIPFKGYHASNEYIMFPIMTNIGTIYFCTNNYSIAFQDTFVSYVRASGDTSLSLTYKVENGFMYFQLSSNMGYNLISFIPYITYCSPTRLDEHLSYDFE